MRTGDAEIARLQQEAALAREWHAVRLYTLQEMGASADERSLCASNAVNFLVPYCKLLENHIEQHRTGTY